jgi:hypothetical protein
MLCVTKSSGCNHVCQVCLLIDGVTHAVAQNFQRPCSCDEIEKAPILRPVLCAPMSKSTGTGPGLISRDFKMHGTAVTVILGNGCHVPHTGSCKPVIRPDSFW